MQRHEPLEFIKKLIFLPISGPLLSGKRVGKYLAPFQQKIIKEAYKADGSPRQNLVLCWSRKWGKSMIASWFLNYLLENKEGWRGIVGASTFDQSEHLFSLVANQVENNEDLSGDYKVQKERIVNKKNGAMLSRVYSNASANLGNIGLQTIIMDQVESMKSRENYDVLQTGMMLSGTKPHIFFLVNSPNFPSHWSIEFIESRRKEKRFTFFEYAADKNKPWATEEAKCEANPFYALYSKAPRKYKHLKSLAENVNEQEVIAKGNLAEQLAFRRYTLGQRISAKAYQWVRGEDLKVKPIEEVLKWKNVRCVVGIDLALTHDFCSAVFVFFEKGTNKVAVHPILHIANTKWRERPQQVLFKQWDHAGHIVIQNRDAISKDQFLGAVSDFEKEHDLFISMFVWDRGLSAASWTESYSRSTLVSGTAFQLAGAIRHIEARAAEKNLFMTSENPCLRWQFDCAITSEKSKGYCLLTRASNKESIDACQATVLATKWHIENPYRGGTYMTG